MASIAEDLDRAADLIQERGWVNAWELIQAGVGASKAWGADGGPLCIEGAIGIAAGVQWTSEINACPAGRAVAAYLEIGDDKRLFNWNDALRYEDGRGIVAARTATEVVEVLRAAAVIEAAKERAEVTA